jgi:hypothetical protein
MRLFEWFFGLFAGTFGLLWLVVTVVTVIAWFKGLVMAFSASVILGIVCFFLQVPFPIFAIAYWLTGVDLAQRIAHALPQIFGS